MSDSTMIEVSPDLLQVKRELMQVIADLQSRGEVVAEPGGIHYFYGNLRAMLSNAQQGGIASAADFGTRNAVFASQKNEDGSWRIHLEFVEAVQKIAYCREFKTLDELEYLFEGLQPSSKIDLRYTEFKSPFS